MTFVHAPTQPIHDLLASGQRIHNFSSWGQRVRHFLVQGLSSPRPKGKEASKGSLFRTRARSSFSAMPKVSHAARRPHVGPQGPNHGDGGRGGVGWGAPKAPPYGIFHPLINMFPSLLSVRPLRAPIGLINYTATSTRSNLTVMRQQGIINKGRRGEGEAIYNTKPAS